VVVVSYSDILARNHANDFRRVVNDPLYRATFPTMCLDRDSDREIATTKRGKRIATSVDGTLTGLGGNLIIIDDPLKLGDDMSEAVRARVIEWYRSTLLSRGDDKTTTRIVVVMQRVHQNDLVGYLQEQALSCRFTSERSAGDALFHRKGPQCADATHRQGDSKKRRADEFRASSVESDCPRADIAESRFDKRLGLPDDGFTDLKFAAAQVLSARKALGEKLDEAICSVLDDPLMLPLVKELLGDSAS
jgi:hypothetical protein